LHPLPAPRPQSTFFSAGVSVQELEKVLIDLGDPPSSEEEAVSPDSAELAALELGIPAVLAPKPRRAKRAAGDTDPAGAALPSRPAVITVMGHVDHGKTTLLDALRSTSVAAREAGGITQHVGAFEVRMPGSGHSLTFLDTPGHAAFSAMRARGAAVTDLVVLVVAADDGVMPQTKEALAHAQAAGCPIVVAITKCDLPAADPEKVRRQLATAGLPVEGYGGGVQTVEVAATQGKGLLELEEALMLEGEMLELRADPKTPAAGTVIEARLDRGQGPIATIIVTKGTLKVGQPVVVGSEWGKVRALRAPGGAAVGADGVPPGLPAELVGLKGLPLAGDDLMVVASEERAQRVSRARAERAEGRRHEALAASSSPPPPPPRHRGRIPVEHVEEVPEQKIMPIVVKADVQGSAEAVRDALSTLSSREVIVQVIHAGVGPITYSDVALAVPSGAKVLGFNVKVAADAEAEAKARGVEILTRRVIYELLGDVGAWVEGMTPRELEEVVVGTADVLATFQVSVVGKGRGAKRTVAGCRVGEGSMRAGMRVKVLRSGEVVAEGLCESLRRHRLEVDAVGAATECGVAVEGFEAFQPGDVLQCVDMQ
jgi:translation initiation factor IF-2